MQNNFNSLMEIIGGLHLHPVQRLKETWEVDFINPHSANWKKKKKRKRLRYTLVEESS
jgi:hypothetical protein